MSQPPPLNSQAAYAFPPPPPRRNNVPAILSLVFGILGCIPFIASLIAVILGFVGLSSARRPDGSGKGMAIAGLTLGIVGVLGWSGLFGMGLIARQQRQRNQAAHVTQAFAVAAAKGITPAAGTSPTAADKYDTLIGEGFQGSGFVIRHRSRLWGVCSLHQFDGEIPTAFTQLEGDDVELDTVARITQKDVQALAVIKAPANVQYLSYEAEFALLEGDEVYVFPADGGTVPGVLTGVSGGMYKSSTGPRTIRVRPGKPIAAAGASGSPVILKRTGSVIGVLLNANDSKQATLVGFETLCLPAED